MIDGVWGCGKSYFVENTLSAYIKSIDCIFVDPNQKYVPIIYSVYGAKTAEKIQLGIKRQIALSEPKQNNGKEKKIHNLFNPKTEKFLSNILGGLAEHYGVDSNRLLDLFDLFPVPKNIVLIFDDVERSEMSTREVLGVINKYAEREKVKVIVICNESQTDEVFKQFKEKTIRYSLHYLPSIEEAFDSIIKELSSNKSSEYLTFIKNNKQLILDIFRLGKCDNLRTLIFVLDIFDKVYHIVSHCQFADELCKGFLSFACIYSIEYKSGIDTKDLSWLTEFTGQYNLSVILDLAEKRNAENNTDNKTFIESLTKYGDTMRMAISSKAIANYIQFGDFDSNTINLELKKLEGVFIELRKTDYGKCLLQMMDWRTIEDSCINDMLSNVESFIKQGKYTPYEISILYARYLELKMNNVICRDIDDKIFYDALNDQKKKWTYIVENDLYIWREKNNIYDTKYEKLKMHILDINNNFIQQQETENNENLLHLIRTNNIEGYRQYAFRTDLQQLLSIPIDKLWDAISHSNKEIQLLFIEQLKNLFPPDTDKRQELIFVEKILPYMQDVLANIPINFSLIKYKGLALQFQGIMKKTIWTRLIDYVYEILQSGNYQENMFVVMNPILFTFSLTEHPAINETVVPFDDLIKNSSENRDVDVKACHDFWEACQ